MPLNLDNLGTNDANPVEQIDRQIGTFKPNVPVDGVEGRLPTEAVPKAPDPSPFTGMK